MLFRTDLSVLERRPPFGWPTLATWFLISGCAAIILSCWNAMRALRSLVGLDAVAGFMRSPTKLTPEEMEALTQPSWGTVIASEPDRAAWFLGLAGTNVVLIVGLLLERHWARVLLAVLSALMLGVVAPLAAMKWIFPGRPVSGRLLGVYAIVLLLMVSHRYRLEPTMLGESVRALPLVVWGMIRLCWEQVRRALGFSYLDWSVGPLMAAHGGMAPRGLLKRQFEGIDYSEGVWTTITAIEVKEGPVRIADLDLLNDADSFAELDLPAGTYTIDLQLIRCIGESHLRAIRARVLATGEQAEQRRGIVNVGVDSGTIGIEVGELRPEDDSDERDYEREGARAGVLADSSGKRQGVWFHTGFGDGSFEVSELLSNEQVVGLEIDMLPGESAIIAVHRSGWWQK